MEGTGGGVEVRREALNSKGEGMNYSGWLKTVPAALTGDSLWKMEAYRLALFAGELAWHDVTKPMRDSGTLELASQLYEAIGSIEANLSEGYSSARDRARFYEYSPGSASKSRTWYCEARHILGEAVAEHRMRFLMQIVGSLLTMAPQQRGQVLREETVPHTVKGDRQSCVLASSGDLSGLLTNIPLP